MKIKLLLLFGVVAAPLLLVGQTTTKPCLFNKGKMSIVGKNDDTTVLYVQGDFIVGSSESTDADQTLRSNIYVSGSKTVITGDFIQNAQYVEGQKANAFSFPTTYSGANISSFVFQGIVPQAIKTNLGLNTLRKGANNIQFPDLVVNNSKAVTVSPEVAVAPKNLTLTKGKLILDSRRVGDIVAGAPKDQVSNGNGGFEDADDKTINTSSILAHFALADGGAIKYTIPETFSASTNLEEIGNIQVRMELDPELTASSEDPNNKKGKSIVGMGSPFQRISADYFMWNHLMFPYNGNIIGPLNYTETNPRRVITAGEGFVTGIDLKGVISTAYVPGKDWDYLEKNPKAFPARAKHGYTFDRFAYDNPNNIYPIEAQVNRATGVSVVSILNNNVPINFNTGTQYVSVPDYKPYDEKLTDTNITKTLIAGFNYFSNPYTAPLDVSALLGSQNAVAAEWGVTTGPLPGTQIYDKIWILNPTSKASASFNLSNGIPYGTQERIYAQYTYLIMSGEGGTADSNNSYTDGSGGYSTVAPLQMFLVYARAAGVGKQFTIPKSKRKIDGGGLFLRSTNNASLDDFLFEVTDLETNSFDRAAIVIRTPEQIKQNGNENSLKTISSMIDNVDNPEDVANKATATVTTRGVVDNKTLNGVLYTENNQGEALESNFLSAKSGISEITTTLFFSPSQTKQKISLGVSRLPTMDRTSRIFVTDTRDNKTQEVSDGSKYQTTSSPTDAQDRFKVRFVFKDTSDAPDDMPDSNSNSIYSYYKDNVLTVAGLENEDINSVISIYDVQGRLLNQTKVVDTSEVKIPILYATGAYIVKVLGKKSYVSKFLVK